MDRDTFTGLSFQLRISCIMGGGLYDDPQRGSPRNSPRGKYRNMIEQIFGIEPHQLIQTAKQNLKLGQEFIEFRCRLDQFAMFIVERNDLFSKESHTHRNQIRELRMEYITLPPSLETVELFETHHFAQAMPCP